MDDHLNRCVMCGVVIGHRPQYAPTDGCNHRAPSGPASAGASGASGVLRNPQVPVNRHRRETFLILGHHIHRLKPDRQWHCGRRPYGAGGDHRVDDSGYTAAAFVPTAGSSCHDHNGGIEPPAGTARRRVHRHVDPRWILGAILFKTFTHTQACVNLNWSVGHGLFLWASRRDATHACKRTELDKNGNEVIL